jgi:hypothetical protein
MKYYLRFVLYLKVNEVLFEVFIVCEGSELYWYMQHAIYIAWFTCIWSCVVTYGPTVPVQLSIVRCPRRGTTRIHTLRGMKAEDICIAFICIHWSDIFRWCGFISSEIWRQRTYTLHSYAYIEVIFVGIVDTGKCYTTYCGCSRKWDGIGYIGTTEFYIYKYFWS